MTIDLSTYNEISCALLVRIDVPYYKDTPTATPIYKTLLFSDYNSAITHEGLTYIGLGNFVAITGTSSELKNSSSGITITITGIPDTSIAEIVNSRMKGSTVQVYRMVMDKNGLPLSVAGNPAGRFFGLVSNYTLDENWDNATRTSSNTIGLICSSKIEILENKVAGRKTNPKSWRKNDGNDPSMDRVPSLIGANFNFGAPS